MELNKKNTKRIMLLISFTLVLYWGLHNISEVGRLISALLKLLSPFIIGLCLAFVLNLILCPLERLWDGLCAKSKRDALRRMKRTVCLTLSLLVLLGAISAIFFILIPQLKKTISGFSVALPDAMAQLEKWWLSITTFFAAHNIVLPIFDIDPERIVNSITSFFTEQGTFLLGRTMDITISIVSAFINFVLALVFSLYVLAQKEKLGRNSKKLIYAIFRRKTADRMLELLSLTSSTFTRFVSGQMTEALILGTLCFLGMSILRLPYALVVSVVICFTSLVPIFGAWIGAIVGAFLIIFVSPIKALWFVIFLAVLQQVEGNVIYPKVVGKSVGLPGIWVLAAVTIGGGLFGVLGMLFGVPVFSVIYVLVGEFVRSKSVPEGVAADAEAAPDAEAATCATPSASAAGDASEPERADKE